MNTELYTGKGFMTALKMLESGGLIAYKDIKRLLRPFRRLPFPIMTDKPVSASLFTQAGQDRFVDGIGKIIDIYNEHVDETGIIVRCLVIPKEDVSGHILYEDKMQTLIDAAFMEQIRCEHGVHHPEKIDEKKR